ncbi:MAG TPA: FAD-dependent oxidoreductase [Acidimicrobiales bacterium]|nr:FAD-dependent oxidoreductase [Acidimicrobiales bacterium]
MIAVVGAGPAGLAAAWRAALAGHEVVVLDRAPVVGGMAGSFEVAGLRVDHGSHRLHPATPAPILAALRGLLGDDLQVRPRHGRIRLLDRWLAFPLRTGDLVRRAPRGFAARAAVDAVAGPLRRPRADTFAEVVRAGLGPAVLDAFYGPYARKLWGVDAADLAGELARRRVSASSPADIARRLVRGSRPEGRTFLYPRRGFGAIPEALAAAAVDAGAELRLGCGVTGLRRQDDGKGWRVALAGGATLDAAQVWSTAPLPALAGMVDPAPPVAAASAAGRLRHRGLVLLYLVLDRPRWTEFDAHYFPGAEVVAARLSEPRNYRDDPGQPADRTVLCAEIACREGDEVWRTADADLAARLAGELAALGLPDATPAEVTSRRLARVYPLYGPGFAEDLAALEGWAEGLGGLITFGRQGLFTPDNTHHALAMGWAAADALGPGGRLDAARWRAARDGFRGYVVED